MVDTGATQAIPADGLTVSPTSRASGDTFTTDKVRFFDEDEIHKYHERTGSLDQALQEFTRGYSKRFIIFANKPAFDGLRGSADLTSFFPSSFWRIVEDDLNGTFGIEHHGEIPGLLYDTWSTFKIKHVTQGLKLNYYWSQISVFVRQSKSKQFVLFIDCPPTVVDRIVKDVLETENPPRQFARPYHDPFIWHALLIEELRAIYDTSVWELRDVVREWEKSRREEPQVELLNEIGRHLIHGNEVLDVADDTIDSIIYQHKLFHERQTNEQQMPDVHNRVYTTVQDKLFTSKKDIKAINARAVSLYERLRHEINLAYHVAARNTTQISIDIAKIARRDNATMKALAFIGVLYLPGTFISGIFGSNFFNYNPQGSSSGSGSNGSVSDWRMSDKFWIYWAITIPVTMFTVLLWIVLDDTMEMYESLVSRARAAARHIWNQLPFGKQPNTEKTDDVNRYRAGGVDGAIWSDV